jgi:hypothetical protein
MGDSLRKVRRELIRTWHKGDKEVDGLVLDRSVAPLGAVLQSVVKGPGTFSVKVCIGVLPPSVPS